MTSATGPSPAGPDEGTGRRIPGVSPALRARLRLLFRALGALSPTLAARLALRIFLSPIARGVSAHEAAFLGAASRHALAVRSPSGHGYTVQAYAWPAPAGAPTVLVVHGWISHAARLAPVIEALRAAGLRVIAFDAPAHGRSSGRQVDLHGYLAAARAVDEALGPAQGLVAHSFGALTAATWMGGEAPPPALRAAVLVGLMRDAEWIFTSFTWTMGLGGRTLARLRALFRDRYGGYPEDFSTRELARHIRVPVLLVHGEDDELVPAAHSSEVAEVMADGEVLRLPGQGHSAPLKDPEAAAHMAWFLAERLAG